MALEGRSVPFGFAVAGWEVVEGPHGFFVVVGRVQVLGLQVGVMDGHGALIWVDATTADALRASVGRTVAVEGYIDGPQRLAGLYWRLLEP